MSIPKHERTFEILLVEDQPGDVGLTREALRRIEKQINLSVASNGEEALAFLRRQGDYAEAVPPDLILLDLNMPRMDGRAVLAVMKKDPALRVIPVIVFTSSAAESDVQMAYELGASCYVTKPSDWARFSEVIGSIVQFWLTTARLPKSRTRAE